MALKRHYTFVKINDAYLFYIIKAFLLLSRNRPIVKKIVPSLALRHNNGRADLTIASVL